MRNTAAALAAIALLTLVVLAVVNCTKSDPVAGTGTDIQLSANPADIDLRTGTKSTITATISDKSGAVQSGVGMYFSTDTGQMQSGGQRVRTNSSGVARDVLIVDAQTDDGKTAKVTVRSGPQKADISVAVGGANKPPQARFSVQPLEGHINQPMTFDGSGSKDPNGDQTIQKMVWALSSDNPDPSIPSELQANCTRTAGKEICTFLRGDANFPAMTRSFAYGQKLTYVSLTVFDDQGLSDAAAPLSGIEIDWNTPPVANAGPDITVPVCGDFFVSALLSNDPDGSIRRYQWDFGDHGPQSNFPTTGHHYDCYADCGGVPSPNCSFTVTLTVWDNGAPTAPGYSCPDLCGGSDPGTQSLAGIDTLKVTVTKPISGATNCPCVCGVDSNGNPNPCP